MVKDCYSVAIIDVVEEACHCFSEGYSMSRIFVRDLMILNPITIAHSQTVEQATQLMARYKIRRLPVIKDGKMVGIVSDRDLRQLGRRPSLKLLATEQEEAYQNLSVEEAMTPTVITVREYDTIKTAIELMLKNTISGLPVVDRQDTLVGMLSNTDILKHCLTLLEQEEDRSSEST